MKAIIYRVNHIKVMSGNRPVAETGLGFAVLLGIESGDTEETAAQMAKQTASLPAYADRDGHQIQTMEFVRGEVTVVPSRQPFLATGSPKPVPEIPAAQINTCCKAFIGHFEAQRLRCGCVDAATPCSIRMEMDGAVSFYLTSEPQEDKL